jgi:hypothetical protein
VCAVLDVQKPAGRGRWRASAIWADLGDELDGLAVVLSAGADAERETARCISRSDPGQDSQCSRDTSCLQLAFVVDHELGDLEERLPLGQANTRLVLSTLLGAPSRFRSHPNAR